MHDDDWGTCGGGHSGVKIGVLDSRIKACIPELV